VSVTIESSIHQASDHLVGFRPPAATGNDLGKGLSGGLEAFLLAHAAHLRWLEFPPFSRPAGGAHRAGRTSRPPGALGPCHQPADICAITLRRRHQFMTIGLMEVTIWYLEQTAPTELRAAGPPDVAISVTRAELSCPELNRFLYTAVGGDWYWLERLPWSWQQWHDWLDRPGVETWLASVRGTPVGYVELDGHQEGVVELAHFGLLPTFIGQGIGGHLLTMAVRQAWQLDQRWPGREPTRRVWVHTCTLDGPAALANYQARGLRLYRTETKQVELLDAPAGPWPGAHRPAAVW
jgi:GNAT superfamily N-acetyltransferase